MVKSKSSPKRIKILTENELERLKKNLEEKQSLLQKMNERGSKELLSPQDHRLPEKIKKIQNTISEQEKLIKATPSELANALHEKAEYHQQLRMVNEKYDGLNDKLNYLRTLVRVGDLTQLQNLVRQGKI